MCACGPKMDMKHAMSCKKGGFITIRHSDVCDFTSNMLSIICKDVDRVIRLSNCKHEQRSKSWYSRVRGFRERGQQAFFNVRVFDPKRRQVPSQCYIENEKEKRRNNNNRVLQIEHGSFTSLVFSIYGEMSREYRRFYNRLSKLVTDKRDITHSVAINWVRRNYHLHCWRHY